LNETGRGARGSGDAVAERLARAGIAVCLWDLGGEAARVWPACLVVFLASDVDSGLFVNLQ